MYLEIITSEAISDERGHNTGSIVLMFDELFKSTVVVDSIGWTNGDAFSLDP